jgi:hypothetical protein
MQNRRFNWLFSLVLIGLSIILVRYSLTWHFLQVADKRLADEGVDGSRKPLTKLTDAQAEALSKYKGSLDLRDLEQVTDFQAVILSQHQGPLYLDGLHHLTDVQAEWFGKCKYYLSLNGLKSLTTVQARHLSRHGGVSLRGIEELSDEQSEIFAHSESVIHGKTVIDPSKFTVLSDAMVESLVAKAMQSELQLDNLKRITDAQAKLLSRHEGQLFLNGLNQLSDRQTELLSDHLGMLHLNGLMELSDTQAKSLSQTAGGLWLNGIVRLTDSQALFLSKQRFLSLTGLKELSDAQAEQFGKHGGELDMGQILKNESDGKDEEVTLSRFFVDLNARDAGEKEKSPNVRANSESETPNQDSSSREWQRVTVVPSVQKTAKEKRLEILKSPRILLLDGLTVLSDTQANYLSSFKGQYLDLSGLKDVSEYAKGKLRNNRHIILSVSGDTLK